VPAVVDVHQHAGPANATPDQWRAGEQLRSECETRLRRMDALGIDAAVLGPVPSYLRPHGIADTRVLNDALRACADGAPDRFPLVAGVVEPLYGETALEELHRMAAELGFAAFMLHPRLQGVASDDVWIRACVREAGSLGMIALIHSYSDSRFESPVLLARVAAENPDVQIVALDAFGSHHHSLECFDLAERCPNVLFDTNMMFKWHVLDEVVDRFDGDRLVFGSNLYSSLSERPPPGPFITPALLRERLTPAVAEKICVGNFLALLESVGRPVPPGFR